MERLKPIGELISLQGKKALITGSASGIGRAMAIRFAEAGCTLQLVDIELKKLEKLKSELLSLCSEVDLFQVDIASEEEIDSLWERLSGMEPDILVNNAGIYPTKDFLKLDRELFNKVIGINLYSVTTMSQHMIAKRISKGGIIINIGSVESIMPLGQDLVHYSMSKMGVIALTRSLAKEYGKNGFRINAIIPGGIMPSGTKAIAGKLAHLNAELIKTGIELKMRLPMNRFGQPDEVARIAVVLASDLSSYVNGALIPVDGGFLSS